MQREREGHFPGLQLGGRGKSFIGLSRGAAGLEHYIRSFIRDELQLPVLFTRNEIEFYTVGIPSSPEGEYFTMINDLCRQHAPFFSSPSPPFVHFSSLRTRYLRTRKWIHGDDDQSFLSLSLSLFSFLFFFLSPIRPTIMLMKPNPRPLLYCSSVNRSRGNNIVLPFNRSRLRSEMTRVLNMHHALLRKI